MLHTAGKENAGAPEPFPGQLFGAVRDGYDVFLALQATRYRYPEDTTPPMPAVMMTKTPAIHTSPSAALAPAEWSEQFRRCTSGLGDEATNSMWGLATTVLQVLADGGAHNVSAGGAICTWYRAFEFDAAYVEEKRLSLAALRLSSHSEGEIEEVGIFFLDMIERCFFAGAFSAAAGVLETLMAALRDGAAFNPFSDDVESCIANIKRLLLVSYTDEHSFAAWQQDANDQIFDAKRCLLEGSSVGRGADASVRVASSLCTVCLNMLLAISGDMMLVRQRCQEADLGILDYLTALCAIAIPFRSLAELSEVLATAAAGWGGDTTKQWRCRVALQLLAVESLADVVSAMAAIGDIAAEAFPWRPAAVAAAGSAASGALEEEEEEDEELVLVHGAAVDGESPSVHRFVLAFMAAHLADVCAPAVTAASHEMALTFARNDLVCGYVRFFNRDAALWRVAAAYLAYSPFANPTLLYNTVTLAADTAAADGAEYLQLCAVFRDLLDAASPHQVLLRRLLQERLGEHPTLVHWLQAFDYYRHEAYADIHRYIISTRFNHGDSAMAAWLAVEAQLPSPLQFDLKCLLRDAAALEDDCVYRIGEAVHNSFLALDVCPTAELAHSLSVCAAISEYRRAAAAVLAQRQDPSTPVAAMLRSSAWCLQCIEKTLTRIDACHFAFHPQPVFALVEHGADTLLTMRDVMRKVGLAGYADLAGPVLPTLQHAFAVCRIHNGPARVPVALQAREESISEKLSRTLETHTTV